MVRKQFAFQREVRFYSHTLSMSAFAVLTTELILPNEPIAGQAKPEEVLEFNSEIVGNIPSALGQELSAKHDGKAMILPIPASEYMDEIRVGPRIGDVEFEELDRADVTWIYSSRSLETFESVILIGAVLPLTSR